MSTLPPTLEQQQQQQDEPLSHEILASSTEDIQNRTRLLENEIKVGHWIGWWWMGWMIVVVLCIYCSSSIVVVLSLVTLVYSQATLTTTLCPYYGLIYTHSLTLFLTPCNLTLITVLYLLVLY